MMTYRTEFRTGSSVTTTVEKRTFRFNSSSMMRGKTLSPGARRQTEQFYSWIDNDIRDYERELRRKAEKALRKAQRRLRRLLERQAKRGQEVAK